MSFMVLESTMKLKAFNIQCICVYIYIYTNHFIGGFAQGHDLYVGVSTKNKEVSVAIAKVPGLTQISQKHSHLTAVELERSSSTSLGKRGLPVSSVDKGRGRTFGSELQRDGADGAASTGPALQVKAGVAGVDVGEDGLILVELGLCETNAIM